MKFPKILKNYSFWILIIFILGFSLRVLSIIPANTNIGFDQARDLFTSTTIFRDLNIAVIGPTAGNNLGLHHGVLFWYYMIPGLVIFRGNPVGALIQNSFFNALSVITLYLLAKDLFKSRKAGLIAAIITAVSYYNVQFSGWLSNPTGTFFTLPLFFYGVWNYSKGKKWGLPLAAFFLGLTIQFELFFIYLIPTGIIAWIILKPKLPSPKLTLLTLITFLISVCTMVATEIKFNFSGIKSIFSAGQLVGNNKSNFLEILITFLQQKWETFYLNFWPQNSEIGTLIGIAAVLFLIYELIKNKSARKQNLFLLLWFFSPAIMFILGTHNAPWFFIGRPSAAILIGAYLISKIKSKALISIILFLIIISNLKAISASYGKGQVLLEPDPGSVMSDQLKSIDYTYEKSNGEPFEINTLTNPLYVNAVWSYHYYWYGLSKYGYLPSWVGGKQLYPYNTLEDPKGEEKYLYLIMDTTPRIPPQYLFEIVTSADKVSKLIETKFFGAIKVEQRILTN